MTAHRFTASLVACLAALLALTWAGVPPTVQAGLVVVLVIVIITRRGAQIGLDIRIG